VKEEEVESEIDQQKDVGHGRKLGFAWYRVTSKRVYSCRWE
jgi:hypothetical protein